MAKFNLLDYNEELEDWSLISSDPAIFHDMIKQYKINNMIVKELYSLDFECLSRSYCHGLILASKYQDEDEDVEVDHDSNYEHDNIIFVRQMITNACGTLALLAILLNCDVPLGPVLSEFLSHTTTLSPTERGIALGSFKAIKDIHNSYNMKSTHAERAMKESVIEFEDTDCEMVETENYHFIAYIPKGGFIWELDGLKEHPKRLCTLDSNNWLTLVKPFIEDRMNAQGDELGFNLMAVTKDTSTTDLRAYLHLRDFFQTCLLVKDDYQTLHAAANQVKSLIKNTSEHYSLILPIIISIQNNEYHLSSADLQQRMKVVIDGIREIEIQVSEIEREQDEVKEQKKEYQKFLKKTTLYISQLYKPERKPREKKAKKSLKTTQAKPPKKTPKNTSKKTPTNTPKKTPKKVALSKQDSADIPKPSRRNPPRNCVKPIESTQETNTEPLIEDTQYSIDEEITESIQENTAESSQVIINTSNEYADKTPTESLQIETGEDCTKVKDSPDEYPRMIMDEDLTDINVKQDKETADAENAAAKYALMNMGDEFAKSEESQKYTLACCGQMDFENETTESAQKRKAEGTIADIQERSVKRLEVAENNNDESNQIIKNKQAPRSTKKRVIKNTKTEPTVTRKSERIANRVANIPKTE